MTDILKILGDDWHNEHPYLGLIEKILPSFPHALALERKLVEVYVEQLNGFKLYKNATGHTTYDAEIEVMRVKKKKLEDEVKKEDDRFNKLLEKFKEQNPPESQSDNEEDEEEDEEEEEEEVIVKQKGKGSQPCRRSLKKEEQRKKALITGLKSSMASSQGKLMELGDEIEQLTKICDYYEHYANASRHYILSVKRVVLAYSETKDLETLIQELAKIISYYEKMMRRYVPADPCEGEGKGLCKTHLLPLYLTVYPNNGFKNVWKCAVHP